MKGKTITTNTTVNKKNKKSVAVNLSNVPKVVDLKNITKNTIEPFKNKEEVLYTIEQTAKTLKIKTNYLMSLRDIHRKSGNDNKLVLIKDVDWKQMGTNVFITNNGLMKIKNNRSSLEITRKKRVSKTEISNLPVDTTIDFKYNDNDYQITGDNANTLLSYVKRFNIVEETESTVPNVSVNVRGKKIEITGEYANKLYKLAMNSVDESIPSVTLIMKNEDGKDSERNFRGDDALYIIRALSRDQNRAISVRYDGKRTDLMEISETKVSNLIEKFESSRPTEMLYIYVDGAKYQLRDGNMDKANKIIEKFLNSEQNSPEGNTDIEITVTFSFGGFKPTEKIKIHKTVAKMFINKFNELISK